MKDLAIIILNWNGSTDTIECIRSINKAKMNMGYTIFLYDNDSDKASLDELEEFVELQDSIIVNSKEFVNLDKIYNQKVVLVKGNENIGFACANNCVMRTIKKHYRYFFLLNNDTIVELNSIITMFDYLNRNLEVDALTCRINYYNPSMKLWNAGGKFTWYGDRKYYLENEIKGKEVLQCEFVTGCALMIKSDVMEQIGYFSEKFFFGEEDFNLCKRMKINKNCIRVLPNTIIYHKVNSSIDKLSSSYVNKVIVHYLNRIIDQRELMDNQLKWNIWRIVYLGALLIKCICWKIDLKNIRYIIHSLIKYSKSFEKVGKKEFQYIMQGGIK